MRASDKWSDYELLDTSAGDRLERWGDVILIRPDPQVLWNTPREDPRWETADAVYHRSSSGGGKWETRSAPGQWEIQYQGDFSQPLRFSIRPTPFKHTGLFPEQAGNWDRMAGWIRRAGRPVRVLNLFGYTGGATLACAAAGASVCHVDASKGIIAWARENASLSGLSDKPIRWIADDCMKFVEREIRRGNKYDGIVMDPPSYGRGPGGEVWKLEEKIYPLLTLCAQLLSNSPLFFLLNSYTTGISAGAMEYLLGAVAGRGGTLSSDEIGLPVASTGLCLPCGSTAVWTSSS